MSHKHAKPKTEEQLAMESFYTDLLAKQGTTVGWGFDKHSEYLSSYARNAWDAWRAAYTRGIMQSLKTGEDDE